MKRYKTTSLNGKPIRTHRKVWILANGEIPEGFHIHHKNEDIHDNRLENLELVSGSDHKSLHNSSRAGVPIGNTDAYLKSNATRNQNTAELCREAYELYQKLGDHNAVADALGVSMRTAWKRKRRHEEFMKTGIFDLSIGNPPRKNRP